MPQLKWKPARRRVINYMNKTGKGGIQGVEFDLTHSFFDGLNGTSYEAVRAMAMRMNDAMAHIWITNGYGSWAPNSELTEELKGHSRVMIGRTRALIGAIGATAKIVETSGGRVGFVIQANTASKNMIRSTRKLGSSSWEIQYGWPKAPHPDTAGSVDGITGEEKPPSMGRGITFEDIAMLHEVGFTVVTPTTTGNRVSVQPRPWLTLAAELEHNNIIAEGVKDTSKSIKALGAVAAASSAGTIRTRTVKVPVTPPITKAKTAANDAAASGSKPQLFKRRKKR